ncbi:hypothetical protein [Phyllobacterium sophorae]|uniref:Uncharacterized protein n=1 Tax=Phyllobacterium sophorae TaxID=1520277 RepID=A0A2P7B3P9_9HYPH|nr:hypothetical protein [Phyllobacterium sophorae]PSH61076.1 hypothetical protein CU103_24255 [Phyllobacterium sophorae]
MSKRDVGAIGENQFLGWCEPEGFRAQKSQIDRLGWDFLLENEPVLADDVPIDRQHRLQKFLIQVKSTDRLGEPPRIKLSALKHLVDADMAAAIAVLEFGNSSRAPTRSLIVPVDEALIAKTLRRVRQEEAKGSRRIHRITVPIPLDRAIELGNLGEGLADALTGMLGGDPSEYLKLKIHQRATCGYDEGSIVGRFFVPGEEAKEKIDELFLGGRRELNVTDMVIERRRFGIALETDTDFFRDAIIEMEAPPLMTASIELEDLDDGEWTSVPVGLFVVPPFIDAGREAPIRLANEYLEIVLDFKKEWAGITFDYDGKKTLDLNDAVSLIEVGAILARPNKKVAILFKDTRLDLPADVQEGPFRHWIHATKLLRRMAAAISRRHHSGSPGLLLSDFYVWIDRHSELLALASMPGVQLFLPRWDDDEIIDQQDTLLAPLSLELAGSQYSVLVEVPIVTMEKDDKEIRVVGGEPRIVEDIALPLGADNAHFVDRAVEISKRYRKTQAPALLLGSFEGWDTSSGSVR